MKLVIVESPTKAKTITKFLSGDYLVRSSYGHVRDLPKTELGVDTEKDFTPKYVIPTKARKNVTQLKKEASKADAIILATDPDREGEAIAWHLLSALGLDKKKDIEIERVVFHEITKTAINEALEHPRKIDNNLVNAQQARRILDRLVGYKLSPFLWKKVARGLSAGRVQSVAVKLVVDREREIEKFIAEEYWSITANLDDGKEGKVIADLSQIKDKSVDKLHVKNETEAKKITSDLENAEWKIKSIEKKETNRSPHGPFTTSTLQQEGARKLRFSAKQTMMIAQQLYEGVELGPDGHVGLITYMRTDSMNLSQESLDKAAEYITSSLGKEYLETKKFKTKSKSAQEAHEAVRPTEASRSPESIAKYLTPQQLKLYNLIWRRFIASQMKKAVFDSMAVDIEAGKDYIFRANGSMLKFDGFLKIYPTKFEETNLPPLKEGQVLNLESLVPEQHFTKPPARYNEASIIKVLEKEGIGRPSTYASIISTVQQRNYITKDTSRYFHPTEIGIMVNDLLVEHFPNIVDIAFTSKMENELDEIAEGKKEWVPTVKEFYNPFAKNLADKYEVVSKDKVTNVEKTGEKCDKCGAEMVIKMGRYGRFTACSNFPTCKNIIKKEKEAPQPSGEKCDKCGGDMVIRAGRFGKFLACGNYPKCKNTKKMDKEAQEASTEK